MAAVDFREKLRACLGGPWPEACPLKREDVKTDELDDGIKRVHVTYEVEPGERILAYLLLPPKASADKPAPGICIWHQHNGAYTIGKARFDVAANFYWAGEL